MQKAKQIVAIIVACVAPCRSLFIRSRANSQEAHRPQNPGNQVRKLWTSSLSRSSRRTPVGDYRSTIELPYLAPWVEEGHQQSHTRTKHQDHGTMSSSTQHERTSMTTNTPYLAPWSDNGSTAVAGWSHDVVLSPPPLAHLSERIQSGLGVLPSARTSIEYQRT